MIFLLIASVFTRGPLYCGTIDRIEGGPTPGTYWAVIEYTEPNGYTHFVDVEPRKTWEEGDRVCWR